MVFPHRMCYQYVEVSLWGGNCQPRHVVADRFSANTTRLHGRADSSTPTKTYRLSWRPYQYAAGTNVESLHSIEHCGSRICLDLAFHSPKRVPRGLFR